LAGIATHKKQNVTHKRYLIPLANDQSVAGKNQASVGWRFEDRYLLALDAIKRIMKSASNDDDRKRYSPTHLALIRQRPLEEKKNGATAGSGYFYLEKLFINTFL